MKRIALYIAMVGGLTLLLHSQGLAETKIEDDFSADTSPQWTLLEGMFNKDKAQIRMENGRALLGGAAMRAMPCEAARARVRFFLPESSTEWASAALTFYGKDTNQRGYAMVIFGAPYLKPGQVEITFFQLASKIQELKPSRWYTIAAECDGVFLRMKVWADGQEEPKDWDLQVRPPEWLKVMAGVGIRTYGMEVPFDDFRAESIPVVSPITWTDEATGWRMAVAPDGTIRELQKRIGEQWLNLAFRRDQFAGPAFSGVMLHCTNKDDLTFEGTKDEIRYRLHYEANQRGLAIVADMKNLGKTPFRPEAARLMLGLNTEMIKYPDWNQVFFPTLLRGEKTHFWGYFMSPEGRILTIGSADPIASWNYEFQPRRHRIYTVSLDMLHALPLPARHPQDLTELKPGQQKTWTVYLQPVDRVEDVKPTLAESIEAPMIEIDRYTVAEAEAAAVTVFSGEPITVEITGPKGRSDRIDAGEASDGVRTFTYLPDQGVGVYKLTVSNQSGKTSEAMLYQRRPWSWYLKQARREAVRSPQKAANCVENWMGHFSAYLARRYFPDEQLDRQIEQNFRTILPLMYDVENARPTVAGNPHRIQNTFYMVSLLADVYQATGNLKDLEMASRLADWLADENQDKDGVYRAGGRGAHYTCVAYAAKSMLELAAVEKQLGRKDPVWQKRFEKHYASAKAAIDDLERRLDNIGTEGQATYEDGMIGCCATQLALFALWQDDPAEREKYLQAAQYMFDGHRCLSQMLVPDCRMNEGSLRFWEAQYDVLIPRNMMNSPHGWSAWRIPGLCYMYQLTGDEQWLRRAMNGLGACVQLIDAKTGRLRWAFVQDPHIRAPVLVEDPDSPNRPQGKHVEQVIGEQYVEMISHFWHPPIDKAVFGYGNEGGSCDNDVHEVFKCLEEVALTSAYVVERSDGTVVGYNCRVEDQGGQLVVTPLEPVVNAVHVNLKTKHDVTVQFPNQPAVFKKATGMRWLRKGP